MKFSSATRKALNYWDSLTFLVENGMYGVRRRAQQAHAKALNKDISNVFNEEHTLYLIAEEYRSLALWATFSARNTEEAASAAHRKALDNRADLLAELGLL